MVESHSEPESKALMPRVLFYDKMLHLIEYPPQTRIIRFALNGRYEKRYMSFPYVQMGRFDPSAGKEEMVSLHVSFSNKPMTSMKDDVFLPMLPNCWSPSLQVCIYPQNSDFQHFVELFYGAWFTSTEKYLGWNTLSKAKFVDIDGIEQTLGPDGCKDTAYKVWEQHTKKDPNFSLRVNWPHKESWLAVVPNVEIRDFATFRSQKKAKKY